MLWKKNRRTNNINIFRSNFILSSRVSWGSPNNEMKALIRNRVGLHEKPLADEMIVAFPILDRELHMQKEQPDKTYPNFRALRSVDRSFWTT